MVHFLADRVFTINTECRMKKRSKTNEWMKKNEMSKLDVDFSCFRSERTAASASGRGFFSVSMSNSNDKLNFEASSCAGAHAHVR